jgi:hypothetical protein
MNWENKFKGQGQKWSCLLSFFCNLQLLNQAITEDSCKRGAVYEKEVNTTEASILNGKKILAVDDQPDVSAVLEEGILQAAPGGKYENVTSYEDATTKWKMLLGKLEDYINRKFGADWLRPPGMPY